MSTRVYSTTNIPCDIVQGISQNAIPFSTRSGPLNFNHDLSDAPLETLLGHDQGHVSPPCYPFPRCLALACFRRTLHGCCNRFLHSVLSVKWTCPSFVPFLPDRPIAR